MKHTTRIITGLLFFLFSVAVITLVRINPTATTPTRSTETRMAGIAEPLVKGIILTQEFKVIKDYLCGVDFIFTHRGRNNTNDNTLILLDEGYHTLYKTSIPSAVVKEGDWTSFTFEKPVYIGKGNLVRICLFSNDGTMDNSVFPLFNKTDSIGTLYASQVLENDLPGSVKNKLRIYPGSLVLRTFGAESGQFWLMKIFLGFLALLITGLIIWFPWFKTTLARIRIMPEWVFLFIAIPVSTIFALITPPLQVPDEGGHFFRSYEIATFRFFNPDRTTPASLAKLDSTFKHLHFLAGKKTSMSDITRHLSTKLEPAITVPAMPPNFTLPYLPQALGIFIGKIFDASPLILMYLGRIFNLLISIIIMFYAIRIIPQFKWIFLLLALMPKTLFLFGSLSYDSLTISLSFLTTAVFFYYAFACERNMNLKDLALLAVLVLLLMFCKPPYFLLGLLFFFIPPMKLGKMYKIIMISVGVIVLAGLVIGGPMAYKFYKNRDALVQVSPADPSAASADLPAIRPNEQIKLILDDIPAYLGLVLKSSFVYTRDYVLESFVGLLGWIDVKLPGMLTYTYLVLLILSALILSGQEVRLGLPKKSLLLFLLAATFIVVETAMYVYATGPGRDRVYGVQGRYFIPMAPLFFMLFYNHYFNPMLNLLFSKRRNEYHTAKAKAKPAIYAEIMSKHIFDKSYYLFLTIFCVFTLLFSIYITLIRYYNI
jgi:uncharacterized membrane protein